jgi:sporulation integral membrane protein YtvI
MGELSGFSQQLVLATEKIPFFVERVKAAFSEFLPFIDIGENTDLIKNTLSALTISFTGKITAFVSSFVVFVPKFILAFFVTVIATCYFTADLKNIKRFFICQIPERSRAFITESKNQIFDTFSKYVGAYLTIALITFAELFAGLMFINREYAFLLAIIITAVDILPVFGSGAVLLPWAAVEYLFKNPADGTKILVLYVLITSVRQITGPKIVGNFIGLYPLTALFCVFAGGVLLGFWGILIFPMLAIVIKNLNEKGFIKLYKTPHENTREKMSNVRAKYKRFRKT